MASQSNQRRMKLKTITLIHINLHKCIAATNELVLKATERGIDMALVQEPYNGSKWKAPSSVTVFRENAESKSLVMLFNHALSLVLVTSLSNQLVTTVQVTNFENAIFSSVYSPPGSDHLIAIANLNYVVNTMDQICINYPLRAFFGGDFNSHHVSWGSENPTIKAKRFPNGVTQEISMSSMMV